METEVFRTLVDKMACIHKTIWIRIRHEFGDEKMTNQSLGCCYLLTLIRRSCCFVSLKGRTAQSEDREMTDISAACDFKVI
jgi:hypothetical protein